MTTIESAPTRIQQDAAKVNVNLAASPSAPLLFSYDTHESLKPVQAPTTSAPKSYFSRVVDWFKMKIWGQDPQIDRIDEPAMFDSAPTIPLEKPAEITDEMLNNFVNEFQKLLLKARNHDNDVEELFADKEASGEMMHKILIQLLQKRHKGTNEERKISADTLLQNTQEATALQEKRKEFNENIRSINDRQTFWTRVNFGTSAACVLLSVVGIVANPAGLLGYLNTFAVLSSSGSSLINASVKYSSNKLNGEFNTHKDKLEKNNERIDVDLQFFHESHLALTRVFKNLQRIVEGQDQAMKSAARL